MVSTFEMTCKTDLADEFAAFGCVSRWDFIFGEDSRERTFRNTCAAVNAGIRVNVDPRPFGNRLAGNHAFNRANFNTTTVTNTQTGNDMSHGVFSFGFIKQ
jgi:hypothetical protein